MKVACGILAISLLVLSKTSVSGHVLVHNENNKEDLEIQLLDSIFTSHDVEKDANSTKAYLQCLIDYELNRIEIMFQTVEKMGQCLNISLGDLQHYFKRHSWKTLKKHLAREIKHCKLNNISYSDCLANIILRTLKELTDHSKTGNEVKACIRNEAIEAFNELEKLKKELLLCFSDISNPPLNVTTTESTHLNTTLGPCTSTTNITTASPNSTFSPLLNSTTVSPVVNVTSTPANVSTTSIPKTTAIPANINSTLSPNNSTTTVDENASATQNKPALTLWEKITSKFY